MFGMRTKQLCLSWSCKSVLYEPYPLPVRVDRSEVMLLDWADL